MSLDASSSPRILDFRGVENLKLRRGCFKFDSVRHNSPVVFVLRCGSQGSKVQVVEVIITSQLEVGERVSEEVRYR